jgi:hypothetical protein
MDGDGSGKADTGDALSDGCGVCPVVATGGSQETSSAIARVKAARHKNIFFIFTHTPPQYMNNVH